MKIIYFTGKPSNYAQITNSISRSAQPQKEDFKWLKDQGVTDVINFRTMRVAGINFDEKNIVESLGMKYHNIPTHTQKPKDTQVKKFLNLIDSITKNNRKAHIHCRAGADRTGMYAFIYKSMKNIGTEPENIKEWIDHGLHQKLYPNLISWAKGCVSRLKNK